MGVEGIVFKGFKKILAARLFLDDTKIVFDWWTSNKLFLEDDFHRSLAGMD